MNGVFAMSLICSHLGAVLFFSLATAALALIWGEK